MPPLRVAVVGTGAFGRNHLRVYSELAAAHPNQVQLAAFVETDETRRSTLAAQYSIPAFATVSDLLAAQSNGTMPGPIDAASVCVPTLHHAAVAEHLLLAGIDTLIEKPFTTTLEEAGRLMALAAEHKRILAVGHLERFNPAVAATCAALTRPMFFESHRLSIFTPRSLDVDVVLDLMIHDLDIVLALAQSPVREVRAVGLPVISPRTDIANVRVEFDSGCVANFTASRVSTEQVRKLRLFQPHQYLSLDFARQELLTISVDPRLAALLAANPAAAAALLESTRAATATTPATTEPQHPTAGFAIDKAAVIKGEPLRLELEDFLRAVRTRTPPHVTAEAGRNALALAIEINQQIAAHAYRAGL